MDVESTCDCGHGKEFFIEVALTNICDGESPLSLLSFVTATAVFTRVLAFPSPYIPPGGWQSESDGLVLGPPVSTHSDSGAFNVERVAGHNPKTLPYIPEGLNQR